VEGSIALSHFESAGVNLGHEVASDHSFNLVTDHSHAVFFNCEEFALLPIVFFESINVGLDVFIDPVSCIALLDSSTPDRVVILFKIKVTVVSSAFVDIINIDIIGRKLPGEATQVHEVVVSKVDVFVVGLEVDHFPALIHHLVDLCVDSIPHRSLCVDFRLDLINLHDGVVPHGLTDLATWVCCLTLNEIVPSALNNTLGRFLHLIHIIDEGLKEILPHAHDFASNFSLLFFTANGTLLASCQESVVLCLNESKRGSVDGITVLSDGWSQCVVVPVFNPFLKGLWVTNIERWGSVGDSLVWEVVNIQNFQVIGSGDTGQGGDN